LGIVVVFVTGVPLLSQLIIPFDVLPPAEDYDNVPQMLRISAGAENAPFKLPAKLVPPPTNAFTAN
jgi:hypothetical protein